MWLIQYQSLLTSFTILHQWTSVTGQAKSDIPLTFDDNSWSYPDTVRPIISSAPICKDGISTKCLLFGPKAMSWDSSHRFCRNQGGFLLVEEQLQLAKDHWPPAGVTLTPNTDRRFGRPDDLTWTALANHNGHFQWLSQFPGVGQFVTWSTEPQKWSQDCASRHVFSNVIQHLPCSYHLQFFCWIPEAPSQEINLDDVELKVTANMAAEDNWVEVENETDFPKLELKCSAVNKKTGQLLEVQPPIFWSKDGVYIYMYSEKLLPSTVHDSTKSSIKDWGSDEYIHLKQGTYWCETWIPNSPSRLESNKLLATIKNWLVLILVAQQEELFNATLNNAKDNIRDMFRQVLHDIDNYTIDVIDAKKQVLSNNKLLDTYRFQVHIPRDENSLDHLLTLFKNDMELLKEFYQNFSYLSSSSASLATYCLEQGEQYEYGNTVLWPFTKAGTTIPQNFKCRIEGNKLQAGFCHGNYTHGGRVDFNSSQCAKYDMCPSGYVGISGYVCLFLSLPDTWEAGMEITYKTGMEMSILDSEEFYKTKGMGKSIFEYVREIITARHKEEDIIIWLPVKRLVTFGPLKYIGPGTIRYPYIDHQSDVYNMSWADDHPNSYWNCLALNIKTGKLFTHDCTARFPFIALLNISGFDTLPNSDWKASIPNLILNTTVCPSGWHATGYQVVENYCFKLFTDTGELTWNKAKNFCEKRDAYLPSPGTGYLDWIFRQYLSDNFVSSVWMTEEIHILNKSLRDGKTLDFVNWQVGTDYKLPYSSLNTNGWTKEGENETKSNVLCQMINTVRNSVSITLRKDHTKTQKPICLQSTSMVSKYVFRDMTCYINGRTTSLKYVNDSECLYEIGHSQGYYECHLWMLSPSPVVKSNVLLNRMEKSLTFAVNLSQAKTYDPKEHDSTFFSSNSNIRYRTDCSMSFVEYLQSRTETMNIHANSFFYSRGKDYSLVFHNFNVEFVSNSDTIVNEYDMMLNLEQVFEQDQNFSECPLISIQSTIGCIGEVSVVYGISERNLTWPTVQGSKVVLPDELCITSKGEPVTRECKGNFLSGYKWGEIAGGCTGRPSNVTKSLWNLNQEGEETKTEALETMCNLTVNASALKAADIHFVATKFQSLCQDENFTRNDLEGIVETLNNIMEADDKKFESVHKKLNTSSILFEAFKNITSKVEMPSGKGDQAVNATRNLISVERLDLEINSTVIGYQSIESADGAYQEETISKGFKVEELTGDTAIIFPPNLTYIVVTNTGRPQRNDSGVKKRKVKLTFAVYRTPKLFQDYKSFPNYNVGTNVIQATYNGRTVKNLKRPVTLLFKHSDRVNDSKCVFWDFKKNRGLGGWSTKGCWKGKRRGEHDVCYCNHLTCFAQLMNYNDEGFNSDHALALDIITIVGCSLSIIGLLMVFATFSLFKKWRRSLSNKILVNLSFSVFCSLVIFLAGINQTWNLILCRSVAVALHYFILASFGWMLVEAVHQYLKFVKVVGTYIPRFLWKASVSAWGVPVLPIIIVLVYDSTLYDSNLDDDSPAKICWMSSTGFFYAFLPPLALTMMVNLIMFSLIMYGAACGRTRVNSTMSERKLILSQLSMAVCVFFLLGFTWIFGILSIWKGRLLFSYLFCIFNTLQGFFIFLFHVCRERSARRLWKDFLSVITKHPLSTSDPLNSNNILSLHYKGHMDTVTYNQGGGTYVHPRRVSADTARGSVKSHTVFTLQHSRASNRP